MRYRIVTLAVVMGFMGAWPALAQTRESSSGQGTLEVTIIPGGGTFFTESKNAESPGFGNYDLGGSATVNISRFIGFEGEVSGALGIGQNLDFSGMSLADVKTPHLLSYNGNVIVHVPAASVAPYVTGGVGGLSLFERAELGVTDTATFFTTNVGGGVKWYSGRLGLRADYRFIAVPSKDDAPAFFGQDTRYAHRVYGGVILNVVR